MIFPRLLNAYLGKWLGRKKSLLVWGPRQTGKTTTIERWLGNVPGTWEQHHYLFQDPSVRRRVERNPSVIAEELEAGPRSRKLIFIDEVQKVPALMDSLQLLMDTHGAQWKFVLTGSSARKIRIAGGNLLPGRIFEKRLDPLLWDELGLAGKAGREHLTPVPRPEAPAGKPRTSVRWKLEDALTWGCLPEIPNLSKEDRAETLRSYVSLYLEQEIRAEALVRKLGAFNRFLELAAREAGTAPNLTRLSQESGVSVPAIQSYYAILEDTFVVERIEPYLRNARKRLMATPRYYFFDPGVRNACAGLPLEPGLLATEGGRLFEHHIILETVRRIRLLDSTAKVHYWRTSHGAEVDMVVDLGDELVPIEIKYTANVRRGDLTGIKSFLEDYGRKVRMAWVVSLAPKPRKIDDKITVIPWTAV